MECPEGTDAFNYHWIVKNDLVPLALAHPSNTTLTGDQRRITWLLAIYPSLLITLTPGYFWYLALTPDGPGHVKVLFGGGMSADWMADPDAPAAFPAPGRFALAYDRLLGQALRHRGKSIALALGIFALSLLGAGQLQEEFSRRPTGLSC